MWYYGTLYAVIWTVYDRDVFHFQLFVFLIAHTHISPESVFRLQNLYSFPLLLVATLSHNGRVPRYLDNRGTM